jgi:hypothetical protein
MLMSPERVARSWVGDMDVASGRVALAAFAIRDAGMGVGLLWSLARGYPVRHWYLLGIAYELVDVTAVIASKDRLSPPSWTPYAWNVIGLVGILGGAVVAAIPDEPQVTPQDRV